MKRPEHEAKDFASLWVSSQPKVAAYIASVVNNFHETEDVLQKVAKVAFEKHDQFDRSQSFTAWVNGITRFELMRWRRDKARDRHIFSDDTIRLLGSVTTLMSDEFDDRRMALQTCFEKLDRSGRELVELRYLDNQGLSAIADRLGIKQSTVRVRLYRVRRLLAECIQRRMLRQEGRHA